jgi:hypothetical protein
MHTIKKIELLAIVFLAILLVKCNANRTDKSLVNNDLPNGDTVKVIPKIAEFNPSFYLKIYEVHLGTTWYDDTAGMDKIFRVLLYNNEEHISVVVETIGIGEEGAGLTLLKQTRITERVLNMPDYTMNKVDFKEWINNKEVKMNINDSCRIINLESLSVRQCE